MLRLNSLGRALCLATGLLVSAGAATATVKPTTVAATGPLSATGGSTVSLVGLPGTFNPTWFGDASLYTSSFDLTSMLQGASLLLTTPASVTYTLVGFEAAFNNAFVSGSGRLDNRSGATSNLGNTFSLGVLGAGQLDFGFLSNGIGSLLGNGKAKHNTGLVMSADNTSALMLFNDSFKGDGDFDDMVVRITVSAVPEPEMLGMLLVGLGVVTAAVRRRRSRAVLSA